MQMTAKDAGLSGANTHRLLAYVADLELEVDRLRKQNQFVHHAVWDKLQRVQTLCTSVPRQEPLPEIQEAVQQLSAVLRDLHEPPGYHPAHDQVIAIAIRPLLEQVFRWQQRLEDAAQVVLELDLGSDHLEWFPARLRHILDNLISNALKFRDPEKSHSWVRVTLRVSSEGYEFQIADNGQGLTAERSAALSLLYRSGPAEAAGLGVGLAVVRMLVEQSDGTMTATSGDGQGTTFTVTLPRYDVADFLT